MEDTSNNDPTLIDAEELRLNGNDAFGTGDFNRAYELYTKSVTCKPTAKAYSNLAATLCKLNQYDQAAIAAEKATSLNPKWCKAWWRRGTVAELQKLFLNAHSYYQIAVDISPKEKAYKKALKNIEKRLKITTTSDGKQKITLMENRNAVVKPISDMVAKAVEYKIWIDIEQRYGGNVQQFMNEQIAAGTYPTSKQYILGGLIRWVDGLRGSVAGLTVTVIPDANQRYLSIQPNSQRTPPTPIQSSQCFELFGHPKPMGAHLGVLFDGFCHLGGQYTPLEMGVGAVLCPQPRYLQAINMTPFQGFAVLMAIDTALATLIRDPPCHYGKIKNLQLSNGVLNASKGLYQNLRVPDYPHKHLIGNQTIEDNPTPQDIVNFIKNVLIKQLGKKWSIDDTDGLRKYVMLQYQGTIMYAYVMRMLGQQYALALQYEKWANEFITLADEEFNVTKDKSYELKGASFRRTLRVGALLVQLQSHKVVKNIGTGKAMIDGGRGFMESFNLCIQISNMVHDMLDEGDVANMPGQSDYVTKNREVAYCKKPLAIVHSLIAHNLVQIASDNVSREVFHTIASHHGLILDDENDTFGTTTTNPTTEEDYCDPYKVIAKHYELAAINEVPDASQAAIYYYGWAANLVQAKCSESNKCTLGLLRDIITKAEKAEKSRDVHLFGENQYKDGSYEAIAKLTARYYKDKPDSFVVPQVKLIRKDNGEALLVVDDDNSDQIIICDHFERIEQQESTILETINKQYHDNDIYDTTELEKEFGIASVDHGIPTLETLCIRTLHKSNCEYAKGETDGATIQYKAMMAMAAKANANETATT